MTAPLYNTAEMALHKAYRLDGVYYYPHYSIEGAYVSPGYGRTNMKLYSVEQLKEMNAQATPMNLWRRFYEE